MKVLKQCITTKYNDAFSSQIVDIEGKANFQKLNQFFSDARITTLNPTFELFHDPIDKVIQVSNGKNRQRREPKISIPRNETAREIDEINRVTRPMDHKNRKIEWWRQNVVPKAKELWDDQRVLNLADFVESTMIIDSNTVGLSFTWLNNVNKSDKLTEQSLMNLKNR
jgi:hypothetical protein